MEKNAAILEGNDLKPSGGGGDARGAGGAGAGARQRGATPPAKRTRLVLGRRWLRASSATPTSTCAGIPLLTMHNRHS